MILYEYPFNESIRTMLRLEHLFDRLGQLIERDAPVDHHHALATIFEIMDVGSRADLKSDLLKELEKHRQQLAGYRGNPSISESRARRRDRPDRRAPSRASTSCPGKAGAALTGNEWLMSIRSRISIPGGTCEFDLPAYYAWQQLEPARRRADLLQWVGHADAAGRGAAGAARPAARFGRAAQGRGARRPVPAEPAGRPASTS